MTPSLTTIPAGAQSFNASASDNPLINPPALPYGIPAFDKIKPEHLEPALNWAIDITKAEIDAVKNNPEAPSFENTIEALERAGNDLERISNVFQTLVNNNTNDAIRALEKVFVAKTTPLYGAIAMDDVLFARVKSLYDAKDTLGLDPEQMMLLENTYKRRVRAGALLAPTEKIRLESINLELANLTTQYGQNVLKHTASYERIATKEELKGVPERALSAYKAAAEKAEKVAGISAERMAALKGNYLIRLQPPPTDILVYGENRALREEISKAMGNIGKEAPYDNRPIILNIVALRHEKAQLLGFQNHADFTLSDRMAGSQKTVEDFLSKNLNAYKPGAEAFFNEVKAFALASGLSDFQPHDFGFYSKKLQEQKFNFNTEDLRPYFEINRVFDGFRNHIEKLFGVEMVDQTAQYPTYRDDAKVYDVRDKETGEILAVFYADYYADAETKRGGAWMSDLRNRMRDRHGVDHIPLVTNSCNYQKPTSDQPALLSLSEVRTLFHEGGHGFHGALARGRYASLNGTSVKWDFVELPSQLQENWIAEKDVLDSFARHYKTGAAIPPEYIKKIEEMATYGAGFGGLRQTSLGLLDMLWHTKDPATIISIEQIEDEIHALTSFWPTRTSTFSTNFGHLFKSPVGYSAGYYSYKWSEVLEADVFEEFKAKGLYDPETAKRLRQTIYEKGGTMPPMEIFKAMMGREPQQEALLRREGLTNSQAASNPGNQVLGPSPA